MVQREKVVQIARDVLEGRFFSRSEALEVARFIIEKDIEGVFSPSTPSSGGGASPAAPALAPVSTQSDAASSARNLGGPSGLITGGFSPGEPDTRIDGGNGPTNTATIPTIYPTVGMEWQDERIASWLENHATGYEHAGMGEIARVLRKKAAKIRRREYLESD